MTTRSSLQKWQDSLDSSVEDAAWNKYDCEIRSIVGDFNRHLSGTAGFQLLDWQLIKAMLWVETGAKNSEWKTKPMQIGVAGDPGLKSLLSGKEGGELILPPKWQNLLTVNKIRTSPADNIRAGIGYLLMRMAKFELQTVQTADRTIFEVTVKQGEHLSQIAARNETTTDILKRMNQQALFLRPGQVLKYQKGAVKRVIAGWRFMNTNMVAQRYNGGGDINYASKLNYALDIVKRGKVVVCAQ